MLSFFEKEINHFGLFFMLSMRILLLSEQTFLPYFTALLFLSFNQSNVGSPLKPYWRARKVVLADSSNELNHLYAICKLSACA